MNPFDLIVLNSCLGLYGALLFSASVAFRSTPSIKDEASTYWNFNPFVLKGEIERTVEARVGLFFVVLNIITSPVIEYFSNKVSSSPSILLGSREGCCYFLVTILSLFLIINIVMRHLSRRWYSPILIDVKRESYEESFFILDHGGLSKEHIERNAVIPPQVRDSNMAGAKRNIAGMCRLFNVKAKDEREIREKLGRILKIQ